MPETSQMSRPVQDNSFPQTSEEELRQIYLSALRKRFKSEINRLTKSAMAQMLEPRKDAAQLAFLMTYVYAWHWLQHNVDVNYRKDMLSAFGKGPQAFLMDMLLESDSSNDFVLRYIEYWLGYSGEPQLQQHNLLQLLQGHENDQQALIEDLESLWKGLGLFSKTYTIAYRDLARDEKDRYRHMLGDEDRQRLALIDALPDDGTEPEHFSKLGLIPHMACPQTCRHCMFIFRPMMKDMPEPDQLYEMVNGLTDSVLFTGGDLSKQLEHFYTAIGSMKNISTFAILLNGDFADTPDITNQVLESMAKAVRRRPIHWRKAKVLLQISFDEFHQEVYLDKKGRLKERIPVAKIANIVEAVPRYNDVIQLCLLHKQHALNFSMDLFQKGVFGRLAANLGKRGHQIQVLSTAPSARLKRHPQNPDTPARLIKDASFILSTYPQSPIMLTSSTIDAYGRAAMMDESETVKEKDLLEQVLAGNTPEGESFDIDLMFWFNGWVTLFSAVHMCLGNVYDDGLETIRKRQARDPLSKALHRFDRRLLEYYSEIRADLEQRIDTATGPHQLFHRLTEDAGVRLHMTRRLLENS